MTNKWIFGVVLAASLGLNLLLGGVLIGLKTAPKMPRVGFAAERVSHLSKTEREAVLKPFRQNRPELRAALKDVRDTRRDIAEYLASPDYDRTEAERRFAVLRQKAQHAQTLSQDMVMDAADRLPPDKRAKLLLP